MCACVCVVTPAALVKIPDVFIFVCVCIDFVKTSIDLPPSIQLPRHVAVGVGDSGRSMSSGPPHPSHSGLQSPVRLHRQAAV